MEKQGLGEVVKYFEGVETTKAHDGYYYNVGDAIAIVILGSFCGLRNVNQVHQWAMHEKNRTILREKFNIERVPCYYWLLRLLGILEPKSMNECFTKRVMSLLPENPNGYTVSFDGKTVCATSNMERYENPLHIVSAQISELGLTLGQEAVDGKSNEIPAAQRLQRDQHAICSKKRHIMRVAILHFEPLAFAGRIAKARPRRVERRNDALVAGRAFWRRFLQSSGRKCAVDFEYYSKNRPQYDARLQRQNRLKARFFPPHARLYDRSFVYSALVGNKPKGTATKTNAFNLKLLAVVTSHTPQRVSSQVQPLYRCLRIF
jgi:hypothetical protein